MIVCASIAEARLVSSPCPPLTRLIHMTFRANCAHESSRSADHSAECYSTRRRIVERVMPIVRIERGAITTTTTTTTTTGVAEAASTPNIERQQRRRMRAEVIVAVTKRACWKKYHSSRADFYANPKTHISSLFARKLKCCVNECLIRRTVTTRLDQPARQKNQFCSLHITRSHANRRRQSSVG